MNSIRLSFLTDQDQLVRLNVRRAGNNLTDALVDRAMDDIILTGAYDTRGRGQLARKYAAELLFTESMMFEVA